MRVPLLATAMIGLCPGLVADPAVTTTSASPAPDALAAMGRLSVAPGLKLSLWASEPLIQNITSLSFDNQGRAYVVETGRRRTSVFDVRNLGLWLGDDFALRTEPERAALLRKLLDPKDAAYPAFLEAVNKGGRGGFQDFNRDGVIDWHDLEVESERIRLVTDTDANGQADRATTFADGFNGITSGVAAGVLAQGTNVWFTCIPDLWRFPAAVPEAAETPAASPRTGEKLLSGFGVHIAFGGHDLHGLIKGPDGRIYFTIADRGASVTNREGRVIASPDAGAVFRCEPDGSQLDLYAHGLRNPQELAFDDLGNLWTGDNNGDGGDKARWSLVLEGADYGWRIGWQWLPKMGAWNSERLWHTRESNSAAWLVPPVAHIGHGPAGIAHYPGTGLGERYRGHFFYADFPGGVRTFRVEPDGAFFKVVQPTDAGDSRKWMEDNSAANRTGKLLWDLSPVDVTFPPFGGVIVADWVQGWEKTGKGRLWHTTDPALANDPQIAEVRQLLAEGMSKRPEAELLGLLGHADQRVRLEAQWELAGRGAKSFEGLKRVAFESKDLLARVHALWGIGHLVRVDRTRDHVSELVGLLGLLSDSSAEIRGQAARVLGGARLVAAQDGIMRLIGDPDDRVALQAMLGWHSLIQPDAKDNSPLRFKRPVTEKLYDGFFSAMPFPIQRILPPPGFAGSISASYVPLVNRLAATNDVHPVLMHAASQALVDVLLRYSALPAQVRTLLIQPIASSVSPKVRLAYLLAQRRLGDREIARHLQDRDPKLVLEAARAINDVPIEPALPNLAELLLPDSRTGEILSGPQIWPDGLNCSSEEWRTWVLRRAVNAAFRIGQSTNAAALAQVAGREDVPETVRVEALDALADWARPPKRDRVVGLHRPLPDRDPAPAVAALATIWAPLKEDSVSTNVLIAALKAGAALRPDGFETRLASLANHASPAVRAEAARLIALAKSVAVPELIQRLSSGSPAERRDAFARLGDSKDAAAVATLADWMTRLNSGGVPKELHVDVLDAANRIGSPQLTSLLAAWINALPKEDPLATLRVALVGGDAGNGRRMFAERADWGCQRCHKLNGEGGDVGPELAHIGRTKGREYVLRSIYNPNAEVAAGFETVMLELKDDTSLMGVLREETPTELVIQQPETGRKVVKKSDIRSRERGLSAMPEGLGDLMTLHELRDLIEALSE